MNTKMTLIMVVATMRYHKAHPFRTSITQILTRNFVYGPAAPYHIYNG